MKPLPLTILKGYFHFVQTWANVFDRYQLNDVNGKTRKNRLNRTNKKKERKTNKSSNISVIKKRVQACKIFPMIQLSPDVQKVIDRLTNVLALYHILLMKNGIVYRGHGSERESIHILMVLVRAWHSQYPQISIAFEIAPNPMIIMWMLSSMMRETLWMNPRLTS